MPSRATADTGLHALIGRGCRCLDIVSGREPRQRFIAPEMERFASATTGPMASRDSVGRAVRVTFHLTPEPTWAKYRLLGEYRPEGFGEEGFVHCTDGEALVLDVANRYYKDDPRPFLLLDVDLDAVSAPVVYDDDERHYPHVYGPVERGAVRRVRRIERLADGTFSAIGEPAPEHLP